MVEQSRAQTNEASSNQKDRTGPAVQAAGVVTAVNFEALSAFFWHCYLCAYLGFIFFKGFEYLGCWRRQL